MALESILNEVLVLSSVTSKIARHVSSHDVSMAKILIKAL
jgi:hypothetical protein